MDIEKTLYEICSILLTNSDTLEGFLLMKFRYNFKIFIEKITQRIQMGNWLRAQLVNNGQPRRNTIFGLIFHNLVNGSIESAIKIARQAHHYNLALLLSLFKSPSSQMIREQAAKQVKANMHFKKLFVNFFKLNLMNKRNSDADYVKIFELISGEWSKSKGGCLGDLDWIQVRIIHTLF